MPQKSSKRRSIQLQIEAFDDSCGPCRFLRRPGNRKPECQLFQGSLGHSGEEVRRCTACKDAESWACYSRKPDREGLEFLASEASWRLRMSHAVSDRKRKARLHKEAEWLTWKGKQLSTSEAPAGDNSRPSSGPSSVGPSGRPVRCT